MRSLGYVKRKPVWLDLTSIGNGKYLETKAAVDFLRMQKAAEVMGVKLVVNTAFRSHEYQTLLYTKYKIDLAAFQQNREKIKQPSLVARPGWSTHQAGLSVDINRAPGDDPKTIQADSPIDLWLRAHAAEFGFVNDVKSEPWHWTYTNG